MTRKLLPCPFCDGEAIIVKSSAKFPNAASFWYPTCQDYECPGHVEEQDELGGVSCECASEQDAAELWNDRPEPSPEIVEAIRFVQQALNDWTVDYCPDFSDQNDVLAARERMHRHGTLHYIAMTNEALHKVRVALGVPPIPRPCWCETCRPQTLTDMRFIVCPVCGNKRCPRATNHIFACTDSNDSGQAGSAYENVKPPTAD